MTRDERRDPSATITAKNTMGKEAQSTVWLESIESFHARGMRRVHAFDVYFTNRRRKYSGEIWATKNDRLLLRFLCPTESDYDEAYELHGIAAPAIEGAGLDARPAEFHDVWPAWTPPCVIEHWERWLSSLV